MEQFNYNNTLFVEDATFSKDVKNLMGLKLFRFIEVMDNYKLKGKALELGCGVGNLTIFVKSSSQGLSITGLDISERALNLAVKNFSNINFLNSDVSKLPFLDSSFDFVYGFDIVEHISDPEIMFNQVWRVLKPGGLAHFHIPCENEPFTLWWLLQKINVYGDLKEKYAGHIQRFTYRDIESMSINAGFRIKRISYSFHFFGQILDFIQWFATSMRSKVIKPDDIDININSKNDQKRSLLSLVLKMYRVGISCLEWISYYESILLKKIGKSMTIDLTIKKPH